MQQTSEVQIELTNPRLKLGLYLHRVINERLTDKISLEHFKKICSNLETRELQATAFSLAVACTGSREKLAWLQEQGMVSALVPEWEKGKGLLMDERWHRDIDVATHSLDALDEMEQLVSSSSLTRRYRFFAKLTAFSHDLGKHPEGSGSIAGQREVRPEPTVLNGDPFRVAFFSDHPRNSAVVFRETVLPLLRLAQGINMNDGEIHVAERALELHGRGIDFGRDVLAKKLDAQEVQVRAETHAERMVRSMNRGLLHRHGILLEEAMHWIMMLNQMEVLLGDPLRGAPAALTKDWSPWSATSRAQAEVFPVLDNAVKKEAERINQELFELLTFPKLIGRTDWFNLRIPDGKRAKVVAAIAAAQRRGQCRTRLEALQQACSLAEVPVPENLAHIADNQAGITILNEPLVERFQVWSVPFEIGRTKFRATEFGSRSIGQISSYSSNEELAELIATGAYPKSLRWIHGAQLRPSELKAILPQRGITSFGQLESFLEMSKVDPRELAPEKIEPPTTIRAEVTISEGSRAKESLCLLNGFQHGSELHVGSGFAHIWKVRGASVKNTPLWLPGVEEQAAAETFLREVVLYVSGGGPLILPSHIPNCRVIIGPVKPDGEGRRAHMYAAIIAREMPEGTRSGDKAEKPYDEQILTCYFLRSRKELEKCINATMKKVEAMGTDVATIRGTVKSFLESKEPALWVP